MAALLLGCFPACSAAGTKAGRGVRLVKDAVVYFGSPSNCSSPATIDYGKVKNATPEWRTIQREGVRSGSARYNLLTTAMHDRIVAAVRKAAGRRGCDLVVRQGDITADGGLTVVDLTGDVIAG